MRRAVPANDPKTARGQRCEPKPHRGWHWQPEGAAAVTSPSEDDLATTSDDLRKKILPGYAEPLLTSGLPVRRPAALLPVVEPKVLRTKVGDLVCRAACPVALAPRAGPESPLR